ncbi:MAG: O-antigen ligase family protein [Bacteroidales bacterium]|nr:O-antigen ligase family protein [Bacteroidales bacterium]
MKIRFNTLDKYSWALLLIIISVCFGTAFGGSFQPMRIMLFLFFILYFHQIVRNKFSLKEDQPIVFGLLLFISWIVYGSLSLLWSPDPIRGFNAGIIAMTMGFISLPVFAFLFRKANNPLKTIRKGWLICFLLTAALGIYELITYNHISSFEDVRILGRIGVIVPHASATFGNINDYGTIIAFIVPYLLWGILDGRNGLRKLIYLVAFLLGLLFVVVNGHRLGVLVIGLQALCFLFLLLRQLRKRYIVLGLVLICLTVIVLPMDELLFTMKYRMSDGIVGTASKAMNEGRGALIVEGLQILKQSYGFGVGAGGFQEAVKHLPTFDGTYIDPHNLFVEIFAQYGIFIFLFFCFWLFSIFYFALKNKHITKGARMTVCATIFTLPLIGMMSSHALGYTYYWIFLSCAAVISTYKNPMLNNLNKNVCIESNK